MAQVVSWKTFGEQQKKKDEQKGGDLKELKFITMGKKGVGNVYKIRPLGDIVQFFEYMIQHDGQWRSAITSDPENCPVRIKHGEKPKEVYAVNVLDRADGQIKILKGPVSVFKEFYTFWKHRGKNPGGPNGGDFEINVTGKKGKDYYRVEFLEQTPLDSDEVEMYAGKLYNLQNIYKETPLEEIEQKLYPSENQSETKSETSGSKAEVRNEAPSSKNQDQNDDQDDDSIPF